MASMKALIGSEGGNLKIWDLDSGQVRPMSNKHQKDVNAVVADFSVMRAASGSRDGILVHWNLETGDCLQELKQGDIIHCLAASL